MQSIRHVSAQRSIEDINNRVMKVLKAYDKINAQKVFRSMERMLQVKFANNSKICAPPPTFFKFCILVYTMKMKTCKNKFFF